MKFRMFFSYYWYIISSLKKRETIFLVIGFILFVISSIISFTSVITDINVSNFGLLILTLTGVIYGGYELYLDFGRYKGEGKYKVEQRTKIPIDEDNSYVPIIDLVYEDHSYKRIIINDSDSVFYSKKVNNYFQKAKILKIKENKTKGDKIKKVLKDNKDILLPFLKFQYKRSSSSNKMFYNQEKLCLSDDIKIHYKDIKCYKGDYYGTFLTNIISSQVLVHTENKDTIIADGRQFYPVEKYKGRYYISDISTSLMNNEIGISTIAITKDNHLVVWRQNEQAQSSCNLLVPTGSGGCDWKDIQKK